MFSVDSELGQTAASSIRRKYLSEFAKVAKSIGQMVYLKEYGQKTVAKMKAVNMYSMQDSVLGRSP